MPKIGKDEKILGYSCKGNLWGGGGGLVDTNWYCKGGMLDTGREDKTLSWG